MGNIRGVSCLCCPVAIDDGPYPTHHLVYEPVGCDYVGRSDALCVPFDTFMSVFALIQRVRADERKSLCPDDLWRVRR